MYRSSNELSSQINGECYSPKLIKNVSTLMDRGIIHVGDLRGVEVNQVIDTVMRLTEETLQDSRKR